MPNIPIILWCFLIRSLVGHEIMTVINSRTYVYNFLYEKTVLLPNDDQMDYFYNFTLQQSKEMNYLSRDTAIDILHITVKVDYSNLVANLDFLQKIYVYNNTHFAVNFLFPINSSGVIPVKQNSIRRVVVNHTGIYNTIFLMEDGTSIIANRVVCVNIIYNEWCRVFNTTLFFFNATEDPNIYHRRVNKQMYTMWIIMEIIKFLIPLMYIVYLYKKTIY